MAGIQSRPFDFIPNGGEPLEKFPCVFVLGEFYGGGDEEVNTYSYNFKYSFTTFKEPGGRDGKSYDLEVRRPEGHMDLTTLWL